MSDVIFTKAKLDRFKKAYQEAKANGQEQFTFEGNEFLISYARYLIEYLQTKLA